jgi:DNA-directed RNA polymerase specialized sigma24 family protein
MPRTAFDALDRDWSTLTHSPAAAAALRRWSDRRELRADHLHELVHRIWAAPKETADAANRELARLAPSDSVAARTLLQVLRPGLRSLGRRLAFGGSFDDVDQELLAIAWELIRTYPVDRRPAAIAANVLLDVRKHYLRSVVRDDRLVSLDDVSPDRCPASRSAEEVALEAERASLGRAHRRLAAAVTARTISPTSASVVWRVHVQDHDDADVAADLGVEVRTLQRRRQRAERELTRAS